MEIFPTPKSLEKQTEYFDFGDVLYLTVPKGLFDDDCGEIYKELFSNYTAKLSRLEICFSSELSGVAVISKAPTQEFFKGRVLQKQHYELEIAPDKAILGFCGFADFAHAFTSFLSLIRIADSEKCELYTACVKATDSPVIGFRAVHLCVFHETTLKFLKKCIALCGFGKCSHIVLEFWGMYRYECCPELSWREAYTYAQIKPLIAFANALGIEVIPMLNHFGHASSGRVMVGKHSTLDNSLRLAPLFEEDGWSWCMTNPKTQELLKNCRNELIQLCGKGEYFHIGFDEAYSYATCRSCSRHDRLSLMKNHLNTITEQLTSIGRRPIMWADMMHDPNKYDAREYDCIYSRYGEYKIRSELSKKIIMAEWQYNSKEQLKTVDELVEAGFDTVACPWEVKENIEAVIDTVIDKSLYGAIATTWHTLPDRIWLIPYVCEKMWCGKSYDAHARYQLIGAYHIRASVPACGNYAEAGMNQSEVPGLNL